MLRSPLAVIVQKEEQLIAEQRPTHYPPELVHMERVLGLIGQLVDNARSVEPVVTEIPESGAVESICA